MTSSRVVHLVATLVALLLPAVASARDVLAPELRAAMAAAAPGERLPASVVLADQLRPADLARVTRGQARRQRSDTVAAALSAHARVTQAPVRAVLDAAIAAGRAELRSVLWVGNALLVSAEPAVLEAIARVPGVDRIRPIRALTPASVQDTAPAPVLGAAASYPFFDDFETGSLAPHWDVNTTGAGYVSVTATDPGDPPVTGSMHVRMGTSADNTPSTASMTVVLDLSGQTTVGIRIRHKEYSDEDNPEDGIFVSEDGVAYTQVLSLTGGTQEYQALWVDLDSVLPGLGLDYTSTFHVRFQWADNFTTDGFAFDVIEIGPGVGGPPIAQPEPNIVALQGPLVWGQGFDGSGVLIGSIDSGANWTHTDLVNRIWHNPGETPDNATDDDFNGFVDDVHGWNFVEDNNTVSHFDAHGTNSAGLMVGDGASGRITGMAPGASLVACRVLDEADYWEAQQYLLDLGVDVISSSYSYKWPDRPDYHMFRQITDMELAAGIVHSNSIGNQGNAFWLQTHPIPFNIAAPGNSPSPFDHPDQVSAGRSSVVAVGGIEWPTGILYVDSGRGPAAWEDLTLYDAAFPNPQDSAYWDYPYGGFAGGQPGLVKPDVVAYTESVLTTAGTGGYTSFSGTSAATPQVGGALCLLVDCQPEALPRHLAAALELTAFDLGAAGKDDLYGSGRIRAWKAARRLLVLGRFEPHELGLGDPFTLDIFGPPGQLVYAFYNTPIVTHQGDWNLPPGFFFLDVFLMSPSGSTSLGAAVPNSPILQGLTVWFQFGAEAPDFSWGAGPWVSVPEGLVID